jgi:hypothetical protein
MAIQPEIHVARDFGKQGGKYHFAGAMKDLHVANVSEIFSGICKQGWFRFDAINLMGVFGEDARG